MKGKIAPTILTGLMIISAGLVVSCGQKGSEAANTSMMVVYTTGDAFILSEGKSEAPAKVGMVVREKDVIRTESGTIDLQTRSGSAVRVREMTRVTIATLNGKGDTKLSMNHGGILASVKKAGQGENFSVTTPTAIAGVRGTTFSVDVGEDQRSSVRVIDGSVMMAPRVAALDKFTEAQIQADPNLQKLSQLSQKEVILTEKTQGQIDQKVETQLIAANAALESSQPAPAKLAAVVTETAVAKPVESQKIEVSTRELIDAKTLVTVDPTLMEKAVSTKQDESLAKDIAAKREAASEQVLGQIMDDATKAKLNSEKEIQQHYNKLELIVLKNGEKLRGAVIAQTGNSIVVHSPEGVKKIQRADLDYQEPLF
ncbi:MAG: FecR domain-containing protein [Leptospirales bacterium]|nr:FecR domain-containing protein [Leptospirales bacterium]